MESWSQIMLDTLLLTLTRPASLGEIKTLRDAATNVLSKHGIDNADINKAKLVISEWATNIVKHAEQPATVIQLIISQGKVLSSCVGSSGDVSSGGKLADENAKAAIQRITISLQDNGGYFDEFSQRQLCATRLTEKHQRGDVIPKNKSAGVDATQTPLIFAESGMGLDIIFNLFADCQYQRRLRSSASNLSQPDSQALEQTLQENKPEIVSSVQEMNHAQEVSYAQEINHALEVNRFSFSLYYQTCSQATVRIAVVEDEPMMRELIKGYLPSDYQVTVFSDGLAFIQHIEQEHAELDHGGLDHVDQEHKQAIAEVTPLALDKPAKQNSVFDLVISDISMPNLDGLSLKKRLAENPRFSHIPFIFLTAQEDVSVEIQANHLGIDNYLVKPVQKEKLCLSVERALIRHDQLIAENQERLNRSLDNTLNQALKPEVRNTIYGYHVMARSISPITGGGDFVYQQKIGEKTLLILADVMGHDAQAKLFAHSFSGFFSGFLAGLSQTQQPCESSESFGLTAMMSALSTKLFEDKLLSCSLFTYLALLIDDHGVEVASAGHPQPLLITAKATHSKGVIYEVINVHGPLAGVCPNLEYQSLYLPMNAGQQLLLFTDGLTDCLPKGMKPSAFFDQLMAIKQGFSKELTEEHTEEYVEHSLEQDTEHSLEPSFEHSLEQGTEQFFDQCFEHFFTLCPQPNDDVTLLLLTKVLTKLKTKPLPKLQTKSQ